MRRVGVIKRFFNSLERMKEYPGCIELSGKCKVVYVVEIGEIVKVGISADPISRIGSFYSIGDLGRVYLSKPTQHARAIEKAVHKRMEAERIRSEYFDAHFEQAVSNLRKTTKNWGVAS